MKVKQGKGKTEYGPGIDISLTAEEDCYAIEAYLMAHHYFIDGARTVYVNKELIKGCRIYVDPSARVILNGEFVYTSNLGK